jgi:hypothetical protein
MYADTLMANGDREAANPLLEESIALSRLTNDERYTEFALVAKSRAALIDGDYVQAKSYLTEWINAAEEIGSQVGYLWGRSRLGYILLKQGNLEQGFQVLCQTAMEFYSGRNKVGLAFTLEKIEHFYCASNMPERAVQLIGWVNRIREETGEVRPKLEQMDLDRDLAFCALYLGADEAAKGMNAGSAMSMDDAVMLALEK